MIRELVSRVSRTFTERRVSKRFKHNLPVKVCFMPERPAVNLDRNCEEAFLSGETSDVSATGIGFIVSAIRIKEKYLVGQDRMLNVELDLGGRKIRMQVRGVRYEKVGIHVSTEKYLVGGEIFSMSTEDRRSYEYLLEHGSKLKASAAPVLELGVD